MGDDEPSVYDSTKFAERATHAKLVSCYHKIMSEKEEAKSKGTPLTLPNIPAPSRRRFLFPERKNKRTRKEVWREQIDKIQRKYPDEDPLRIHEWIVKKRRPTWVLATLRREREERERSEVESTETTTLTDDISSNATSDCSASLYGTAIVLTRVSSYDSLPTEEKKQAFDRLLDTYTYANPERVAEALTKYSVETVRVMLRARTRSLTLATRIEV